jgi:hypothetical protein
LPESWAQAIFIVIDGTGMDIEGTMKQIRKA